METEGVFSPESVEDARRRYDALDQVAREVVREVARAMSFGADEYDDRVTDEVIETGRDALFASLLEVQVGSYGEFETWRSQTNKEVFEIGSENVDNAVWHAPSFADTAVVATYQNEREAAVSTLRRQAFGRLYRDVLDEDTVEETKR